MKKPALRKNDFANNTIYTGARYNLEITDFSTLGLVKIAPKAILIAFYRPVIWEARSALLIISGLETTLFIYLTLAFFFRGSVLKKIKAVRSNELLVFSFLFAVILAFFVGFTSILFGVLVRFKAPLLPFLLIVLTTKPQEEEEEEEVVILPQNIKRIKV